MESLAKFAPIAHWLLRIVLASVFVYHGIGKLPDVAGFAQILDMPVVVAWLVTFAEISVGVGIIVGGLSKEVITRLSALAMIPILIGAIVVFHWPKWSFVANEAHPFGGMEYQVNLILVAVYFLIVGNRTLKAEG